MTPSSQTLNPGSVSRGCREMKGRTVAIDFETFYDSAAGYTLKKMDPYAYVHDRRFDPYLVSAKSDEGEFFVGRPVDFCWGSLDGALLVAHNAAFDGMVLNRLVETGLVQDFRRTWVDTADLAAYLGYKRDLKSAAEAILGVKISKAVRAAMDGRTLSDAIAAGDGPALLDYAGDDAELCLAIWLKRGAEWPEVERQISQCNREAGWLGVHMDRAAVEAGLKTLTRVRNEAELRMPWTQREDPRDNKPAGSLPALAEHVRSLGLPVPPSFKKDHPEMVKWTETYGPSHDFIRARLDHASAVPHIARLQSMLDLADPSDNIHFSLKYGGTHTLRTANGGENGSGGEKFNPLNIPKDPAKTFGVDLRGTLIPRPGCVFMIYDYGQIEARIVQWLAGNQAFLDLVSKVGNIYESDAIFLKLWDQSRGRLKRLDPALYASSKERVLGLGFSMGAPKFMATCRKKNVKIGRRDWKPEDLDRRFKFICRNSADINYDDPARYEDVAELLVVDDTVKQWRAANSAVVQLWKDVQEPLEAAAARGDATCSFTLPSGRKKVYFNPHVLNQAKAVKDPETGKSETRVEKRLFASVVCGADPMGLHGGVITENLVQSIARDIMYWGAMDIWNHSARMWPFLWNAYDEVIFEVPVSCVSEAQEVMPRLLCHGSASAWTQGLPLEVEGGPCERYLK